MIKYLKSLFCVVAFPSLLLAQTNYKPGYVVNVKGDTVKGFIDYREWNKNPKMISFKKGIEDKTPQKFSPANVSAFAVTGLEYYESHIVSVSMDAVDINTVSPKPDTSFITDTVFLKVLNKGKVLTLYGYTDDLKPRFYFAESGRSSGEVQELLYHAYYSPGQLSVQYVRRYRVQLQYEAQRNNVIDGNLESMIQHAEYSGDELGKIVGKINGGTGQQFVSQSLFGTRWFAGAGMAYTDMAFSGNIQFGDAYALSPSVSFGLDLLTNKNTRQLFGRIELAFTGNEHAFSNSYEQSQLKVKQYTASISPQAYYNFYNGRSLKMFVALGLSVNFSTYPERYYISEQGVDLTPIKQDHFPDYRTLWENIIFKGGFVVNGNIEIYGSFSPSVTLTDNYSFFGGGMSTYQAGINYLFGAK